MKKIILILTVFITVYSCTPPLITDSVTKGKISKRLEERKMWIPEIPATATSNETQALEFLYAYMPVGDAADFSPELYLENVRVALTAREEMGWNVPENLFLHFVLPIRVNNENMDTSRVTFYSELKDRVKGLSMQDAILAVNHWCHEKVVYTPSDARTSAPSATVRSATGRCGEESTFTVAALRSVGIPARQVYTPRWAHSDNNHAWIEAWADGEWFYMGACEPEPILNTGWFDATAARGMMMQTKVYGDYAGEEDIILKTECYTEINVTKNYADVASIEVKVVDMNGKTVPNASVYFGIYNYAQFYPAATRTADSDGKLTFTAGLGSMVIYANDGTNYGFSQANFGKDKQIEVVLNSPTGGAEFNIVPPVEKVVKRDITMEQRQANNALLAREDSIRNAYTATFVDQARAVSMAKKIGTDTTLVSKYLIASRGNWGEIEKFLNETPKEQLPVALELLRVISEKDLRDTPASVLRDHLSVAYKYKDEPFFEEYILNPRVGNELLTPYRVRLAEVGDCSMVDELIATTKDIELLPELNPAKLSITPLGLHSSRRGDQTALDTYTIAILRSKGIPARHEPITRNLQYYNKITNNWVNIRTAKIAEKGTLKMMYKGKDDPQYHTHFTLSKLSGGVFKEIDLSSSVADTGADISYSTLFKKPLALEIGTYLLTSGTRLANGSVLAATKIFTIEPNKETVVELVMRDDKTQIKVIGKMNPESLFVKAGSSDPSSILATTGRGYFILALIGPKQEPTNHAMRDIAALSEYFNKWGRGIVLICKDEEQVRKFDAKEFGTLPSNTTLGYDHKGQTTSMMAELMEIENTNNLPIFVIADSFGRVVFYSQGYQIGLGEQLKRVIDNL